MTAEEFVRQRQADPEYVARRRAQDLETAATEKACAEDQAEMLTALREAGVAVDSIYDFVNGGGAPRAAIAVLVTHLSRPHHPRVWDGIVRSLSTPEARERALGPLRQAYIEESDPDRRWVIANAIGSMATLAEVADLEGIESYRALFRPSTKPPHTPPRKR